MSAIPCSSCRQKRPGKLASLYWAWFNADQNRSAWKQRFCSSCAPERIGALLQSIRAADQSDNTFACCMCGADAQHDSDPVYLTLYIPNRESEEFAIQLDAACAAKLRIMAQEGAERLPDRGGVVRGPSPSTTAWDQLGLAPS